MKAAFIIFAALLSLPVIGQELPPSIVRSTLATTDPIWTGQRVELSIDLIAPGYFSGSPVFDLPSPPDMLIVPPAGSPMVGSEEIDGKNFITQRHVLTLYPRRPGSFEIPAFAIRFSIKPNPLDHDAIPRSVLTKAFHLEATQPPGLPADGMTLTSSDLSIEESWKPLPAENGKPGDAYVRTIIWKASDLTGISFPPFPDEIFGPLALYRAAPEVTDQSNHGGSSGTRKEVLTYVCKAGGNVGISGFTFRWWDPEAKKIRQVEFPARQIHIIAPPVPMEPLPRRIWNFQRHHAIPITASLGVFALVAGVVYLARRSIAAFLQRLKPTHLPPLNPSGPS